MTGLYCIACGCHEHAACPSDGMHIAPTCWWLRLDGRKNAGLCSSCEDLVEHWGRGGRALLPEVIAERFHRQALFLYENEASAKAWINTPQPLLGDRSPRALILAGEIEHVHQVLAQLRDGAYI
jgi:hypothetical protein